MHLGRLREHCELPQRDLGGAPAEIKFGAFYLQTIRSGGNNFNYFSKK